MESESRMAVLSAACAARLHESDVVRQLRDEPTRRVARNPRQVRRHEVGEADPLHVRREPHHDAVGFHGLRIEQNAAQHGRHHDGGQHVAQHALLILHQHVEGRLDDHRVGAGDGGQQAGEDHGGGQLAPARVDPLLEEAVEQPAAAVVERECAGGVLAHEAHDIALVGASSGSSRRWMWTTK